MCKSIFILLLFACITGKSQTTTTNMPNREDTIAVPVSGGTLEGNLLHPANSTTLVIIVAGSGPTDRNGNSPALPGKNNCYLQIADSLAKYGISSFRYDKRGAGKDMFLAMDEQKLRFDIYVDDLIACVTTVKQKFPFKKVYLAGHSEGSLVAMIAATRI